MDKKIITVLIIIFILTISGCTFKTTADKTFGEKEAAKSSDLYLLNSSGEHFDRNGVTYYYIVGYVGNKAQKDTSNVTILAKFFNENGTLIGNNTTNPYKPKNIPAEGQSYFYVGFKDPEQQITNYTIELSIN